MSLKRRKDISSMDKCGYACVERSLFIHYGCRIHMCACGSIKSRDSQVYVCSRRTIRRESVYLISRNSLLLCDLFFSRSLSFLLSICLPLLLPFFLPSFHSLLQSSFDHSFLLLSFSVCVVSFVVLFSGEAHGVCCCLL